MMTSRYFKLILIVSCTVFSFSLTAQYKTYFTVAKDGSGDFRTLQETIDNCKSFPDKRITIFIKKGVYKEKVKLHSWNPNIHIIGESRDSTIISFGDSAGPGRNSTFTTYTFLVDANDITIENLTIANTAGEVGQAVAVHVEGDRVHFKNCRFLGNQDTLYAAIEGARQYYEKCYIEGTTDFIFGGATALFEACEIKSKKDSYITAASTPRRIPYGYTFIDCDLTADPGVSHVYLGRPWRSYARTVFINCELGAHIAPKGWHNWNDPAREKTVFYAEYNSSGPGSDLSGRISWSRQLSRKEAARYTARQIFGDWTP